MESKSDNSFMQYVNSQIEHFAAEGIRLRDPQPLADYRALVDTLIFVQQKLGTIEHEVALHRLDAEFAAASREALAAWRKIWRDFRVQRQESIETKRSMATSNRASRDNLVDL